MHLSCRTNLLKNVCKVIYPLLALLLIVSCPPPGSGDGTKYSLNITISPSVSGSVTKSPNQAEYDENTQVTLTAVPDSGRDFDHWEGDLTGNTNPAEITMDSEKNVTAVFTLERFVELGGGIEVTVSQFDGTFIYTMITAQPIAKPEANGAPVTIYDYTLNTTGVIPSVTKNTYNETGPVSSKDQIYSKKQTDTDMWMRQAENQILSKSIRQIPESIPGINPAPPSPIAIGTVWNNIEIVVTGNTISATCRAISTNAYFFVDNRDTDTMAPFLADYCTAFDQIYQVNHTHFGEENDVDSNGKVIIIFSEELSGGLLGYFYAVDKYPKATFPDSNEGDIFYMTTTIEYQGDIVKGTLAHEFQHMIYFDEHYDLGVTSTYDWLNEALSQAAEYYNNYLDNHHAWIASFLNGGWPGLSLTHWTSSNYGYGAVFIRYLIDQFGDTAIKNMCSTNLVGVAAVENATSADFNTIFNDFTRALVMSGTGDSNDPRYNFTTLDLQAVQPFGRGGLTTLFAYTAGESFSAGLFAYRLFFANWTGDFGTMNLSGSDFNGTAFGLSQ